ncbi:MAG: PKD domain-containing protein, partial [Spirochaetales bacterium]|nr:PKD domain-containing protein [Spirochaetales bacterium]
MKINVFVLIMALLLLFSSCEGLFEIKGRWNRNDPNYDPTNDPVNQPNLPPIAPSNLKITFFVDEANEDKPCVRLNWQNNSTFTQKTIVERAPEGSSDFSKIGEVKYIVSPDGQDTASEQFVDDGLSTTQLSETGFVYRITAVNPSGSSEVVDKLFYCPPVISFAAYAEATWINEKTADNVNITFYFKNQSYGMIDTYSWNFGDNTEIIAEENPSHIFRTKNIYSITLTCDGKGGKNSYTRDDYVAIGMPQANFSLYTDSGFGAESLIDENNMLVDDGDTIYIQESSVFHDAKLNNWFLIKEPWGRVIEPTSISVQSGSNYRRYSIQLPEFGNGDEDLPAIGQYDFFLQVMDFATHRSQKHQFLNIGKAKLDFKFLYTPEDISITKNAGVMINFENN